MGLQREGKGVAKRMCTNLERDVVSNYSLGYVNSSINTLTTSNREKDGMAMCKNLMNIWLGYPTDGLKYPISLSSTPYDTAQLLEYYIPSYVHR